jgi:Mg-chelatase subunit ChlD
MSMRDTLQPRAAQWRLGTALVCLLLASSAAAATKVPPPPREVNRCECGPMDVVFAIDDTGSMGGSLNAFKAAFPSLLSQIQTASSGDYQLGLVTFKDNVTVQVNLGPSWATTAPMQAAVASLSAGGGANDPEASDQALNTVLHNIVSRPNQVGSFSGAWRTGARRVVVLITDNRPGGFNDNYTGPTLANTMAQDASNAGIKIHAVYVPTGGQDATVVSIMQNYANVSRGLYRETLSDGSDVPLAVQDFMSDCRQPSDVYMKDTGGDNGWEPSSGAIWYSPDIKICNNPNGCASSTNPVFGSPNNYVFVTLRNSGPLRPSGPIGGSLVLYYLPAGGNSTWPGSWQVIKAEHGIFLNTNETRSIRIHWPNVPAPGHYCLLARWVSQGDPMTYVELTGSNTVTNTQRNNNIAWRNIDIIRLIKGGHVLTTYNVRPVPGRVTDLVIRPDDKPFPGRVTVDLGKRMFEIWRAGGGEASGLEGVEGTTLFFGPEGGVIHGLASDRALDERLNLAFHSDGEVGTFPVHVFDLDRETGEDVGGVRYEVSVLSPDTAPFPADLAAVRTKDGMVELTWPHAVHHRAYRILRSEKPEAGSGEEIGFIEATEETLETSALRFFDRESLDRRFFYSVVSISEGGETVSESVSADAAAN